VRPNLELDTAADRQPCLGFSVPLLLRSHHLALPHAVVTVTDSRKGCLGAALDEIGAKVNVVSASSELLSVLASAASAPVVATVPTRMAQRYGPRFGLTLSSAPLKLRLPASSVVWSGRLDQDPASCWIRKQVADLVLEQTVEKAVA
jgi:LysR family transcriptional activator of mexEF-oprN operon